MKKINQKGFSIIEVLIVLAIAGLIMLIVFLAVPALQRNSRNQQRKSDVTAAVGSIQEAISNNNGTLPTLANGVANGKYAVFATTDFTGSLSNNSAVATVTSTDAGVVINNFTKCGSLPNANTAAMPTDGTGATKRSVTAVYRVETAGGYQVQCIDM